MNSSVIPVAIIDPDAPTGSLEKKQPDVNNGVEVHSKEGYFSKDYAELEWENLWSKTWLIAGVQADLPNIGDYFLFKIRHESFIISHTQEGIRAFYNVCPHRGARLLTEEHGNRKVFICPFHSWSFSNNGDLRSITDENTFQPEVVCHRPGLKQARVEVLAGLIFINMDDNAPNFTDVAAPMITDFEPFDWDNRYRAFWFEKHIRANWKTAMEPFMESHHSQTTHPQLVPAIGDINSFYDFPNAYISRQISAAATASPRARTRPAAASARAAAAAAASGRGCATRTRRRGADHRGWRPRPPLPRARALATARGRPSQGPSRRRAPRRTRPPPRRSRAHPLLRVAALSSYAC